MSLRGQKAWLRPILRSDIAYLNEWRNDEETFMYLGGGYQPLSIDQQAQWLDSMIDMTGKDRRFIIVDETKIPIGMIGLYNINWINRTCEIGVYIGNVESRGKGYASDSCQSIETYARNHLNMRKIKLSVVSKNIKAVMFWEKHGYKRAGEFKAERYIQGEYCDLILMEKFL